MSNWFLLNLYFYLKNLSDATAKGDLAGSYLMVDLFLMPYIFNNP